MTAHEAPPSLRSDPTLLARLRDDLLKCRQAADRREAAG
jgi:hypothetical protein